MFCQWVYLLVIIILCTCVPLGDCQSGRIVQEYVDSFLEYTDILGGFIPTKFNFGLSSSLFNPDFSESIRKKLNLFIGGQDEAIEQIVGSFQSWEFSKDAGGNAPLVLAIIGPSGVGKSESAFRIGQALFGKSTDELNAIPKASLSLRGEDFSEDAEVVKQQGVAEARRQMRNQIIQHLQACNGEAIIVFDEVQKVIPGILEIFLPALDANGYFSQVTYDPKTKEPITKQYPTKNVVFIFISDIGHDLLTKAVLRFNDRTAIDTSFLKNEVKELMDQQWERLQFGKTIANVIPYMPLEPFHIDMILHKQLNYLSQQGIQEHKWLRLVVDEEVFDWLAIAESYNYEAITAEFLIFNETTQTEEMQERTKYFAKWGARAGPLMSLRGYMMRMMRMRPLKSMEILHLGKIRPDLESRLCAHIGGNALPSSSIAIESNATEESASLKTSTNSNANTLFLQWCHRKPYMLKSCHILDETSGPGTCQNMQRMPLSHYQTEPLLIDSDTALDVHTCRETLCFAL